MDFTQTGVTGGSNESTHDTPEPEIVKRKSLLGAAFRRHCLICHELVSEKCGLIEVARKIEFRCYVFKNFLPRTSNFFSSTMRIASEYAMCSCSRMRAARVCSSSESSTVTDFCTMMAP